MCVCVLVFSLGRVYIATALANNSSILRLITVYIHPQARPSTKDGLSEKERERRKREERGEDRGEKWGRGEEQERRR